MKVYKRFVALAIALAFVLIVGSASSIFIKVESPYWLNLAKPVFMPPNGLFSIIWFAIYILITILVMTIIVTPNIRFLLWHFAVIGALNIFWCALFFMLKLPLLAFVILIIELVDLFLINNTLCKNTTQVWSLMIIIIAWYMFTLLLNYSIILLN